MPNDSPAYHPFPYRVTDDAVLVTGASPAFMAGEITLLNSYRQYDRLITRLFSKVQQTTDPDTFIMGKYFAGSDVDSAVPVGQFSITPVGIGNPLMGEYSPPNPFILRQTDRLWLKYYATGAIAITINSSVTTEFFFVNRDHVPPERLY